MPYIPSKQHVWRRRGDAPVSHNLACGALLAAGASAPAVTDPTAQDPVGKSAAFLASERGHVGLAGYLSEVALTSYLASLTIEESCISDGLAAIEAERAVESISQRSAQLHGGT